MTDRQKQSPGAPHPFPRGAFHLQGDHQDQGAPFQAVGDKQRPGSPYNADRQIIVEGSYSGELLEGGWPNQARREHDQQHGQQDQPDGNDQRQRTKKYHNKSNNNNNNIDKRSDRRNSAASVHSLVGDRDCDWVSDGIDEELIDLEGSCHQITSSTVPCQIDQITTTGR